MLASSSSGTDSSSGTGSSGGADTVLERGRCSDLEELQRRAEWIRLETLRLIDQAGIGHYSSTLSAAEIFAVLYYDLLRLDPANPDWRNRDRFLLGKGHVVTGLWPVLADLAYFPVSWLDDFMSLGAPLSDHPNMNTAPGIDYSSGSLGHNLSVGTGIALATRLQQSDSRTFVLLGDGELHEGQVWEAAMAASHHALGSLVAIVDANGFCASGPTSTIMSIEPLSSRFEAFGWDTSEIDGNDIGQVHDVLHHLDFQARGRPHCVIARTQKGKGVSLMEANPEKWHFGILDQEQFNAATAEIESRLDR